MCVWVGNPTDPERCAPPARHQATFDPMPVTRAQSLPMLGCATCQREPRRTSKVSLVLQTLQPHVTLTLLISCSWSDSFPSPQRRHFSSTLQNMSSTASGLFSTTEAGSSGTATGPYENPTWCLQRPPRLCTVHAIHRNLLLVCIQIHSNRAFVLLSEKLSQ